jgi:ubiquinone/menaquinone biosynthesis C-methylase UbiE
MKFFEQSELARRYHAYRPRVHEQIVERLVASRPLRACKIALDVACGTGHSTAALTALAPAVYGCDASLAMLSLAREGVSATGFVCCRAEALPFSESTFDLVTVSMAFHWFDQRKFLEEAGRVLAKNGEAWAYNLFFPGILIDDDRFSGWYRKEYLRRYPVPARCAGTLASLLGSQRNHLVFVEERRLDHEVTFTASGLRNYLTTQSNIEAALQRGESLQDIDAWLDGELTSFFGHRRSRLFAYVGQLEIAAPA